MIFIGSPQTQILPSLDASSVDTTIAGVSSGGFMTNIAFINDSWLYKGAGVIAAGPYSCHDGCSMQGPLCDMSCKEKTTDEMYHFIEERAEDGRISPISQIKGEPVWIYVPANDTVVDPEFNYMNQDLYDRLGAKTKVVVRPGEHMVPTDNDAMKSRWYVESPYIADADYDGYGEMLKYITPNQDKKPLQPRNMNWREVGELIAFDQAEFFDNSDDFYSSSMDEIGYAYVPHACKAGGCRIHVSLHGCMQGRGSLDRELDYVTKAGAIEWMAGNDMIGLFPQAQSTWHNLAGCWDFFGYSGSDYLTKDGLQTKAFRKMLKRLMS